MDPFPRRIQRARQPRKQPLTLVIPLRQFNQMHREREFVDVQLPVLVDVGEVPDAPQKLGFGEFLRVLSDFCWVFGVRRVGLHIKMDEKWAKTEYY
jgi:hypothetical protein